VSEFEEFQARAWMLYRNMSLAQGAESANGPGSHLANTVAVRRWLPSVIERYHITLMLDAPCGDLNWMQHMLPHLEHYIGWDVDPGNIVQAESRMEELGSSLRCVNLLTVPPEEIPPVDLIFCRDFLQHLPNDQIQRVLDKFIEGGAPYLITNSYRGADNYAVECPEGGHTGAVGSRETLPGYYYRPANLEAEPFNLKGRVEAVVEPTIVGEDYSHIVEELVLFDLGAMR